MPPPGIDYGVEDGQFLKFDSNTRTITSVTADEATPALINEYLQGELTLYVTSTDQPLGSGTWSIEFYPEHIAEVEAASYADVFGRSGLSESEKYAKVHQLLGDNPTVIQIGVQVFGEDIAREIWGAGIDTAKSNSDSPSTDPSRPSNVIQNSQTQGVGPLPAPQTGSQNDTGMRQDARPGSRNTSTGSAGTGAGASDAPDTHGQGTASSPRVDPRIGGDPLLLASGQLYQQVIDLEVRGRGIHFAFARTYLHQTNYRGPLGFSWDHSYNLWLREAQEIQPDGSYINVVYRSTGQVREDRFVHVAEMGDPTEPLGGVSDATFLGPAGFFDELSKTAGTYRLRTVSGTVFTYNDNLRIESISDPSGNELTFLYQDGLLVRAVDAVGKVFEFINDEYGRVLEITDQTGGRQVRYAYDDIGNLIEVDVYADTNTVANTDYVYFGPDAPAGLEHNLVEVIGPDGASVLSVRYGIDPDPWAYNRVVEQRSRDGLYQFISMSTVLPITLTTVDPWIGLTFHGWSAG
jgi:YD repeat-containing protein